MHVRPTNLVRPAGDTATEDWPAPRWATELFADADRRPDVADGRRVVTTRASAEASLVTVRVRGADALPPAGVEQATADAYSAVAAELAKLPAGHPVRFWNYIPDIHRRSGDGPAGRPLDRYMVFNAGRFAACSRWLGGEDAFPRLLATASGVGHADADLVIHALAARRPGVAVENPRQVPAYRYSNRYGPRPPCFARATVVACPKTGRPLVLVGGTASVRGEASVHVGDLAAQVAETTENLAALLRAARDASATATAGSPAESAGPAAISPATVPPSSPPAAPSDGALDAFTDVRVYYVREADLAALRDLSARAFPAAEIEYVRADLCRQDLLVEIEGVAASR